MLTCDYRAVFLYYLRQLKHILSIVEQHDVADKNLLNARLVSNMFPLSTQVRIACNFSLRACCHLLNQSAVNFDECPATYAGLTEQIDLSIRFIEQIPADSPEVDRVNRDKGGFSELSLAADEYLFQFALPNFFFHVSSVYAIARTAGVPVSKGDFDGYHQYPSGFSFER